MKNTFAMLTTKGLTLSLIALFSANGWAAAKANTKSLAPVTKNARRTPQSDEASHYYQCTLFKTEDQGKTKVFARGVLPTPLKGEHKTDADFYSRKESFTLDLYTNGTLVVLAAPDAQSKPKSVNETHLLLPNRVGDAFPAIKTKFDFKGATAAKTASYSLECL